MSSESENNSGREIVGRTVPDEGSAERFMELFLRDPNLFNDDVATHQIDAIRTQLHKLIEQAGSEADSVQLVKICTDAFETLPKATLDDDPSLMRQYIEDLIGIDPKVAFGAIFDIACKARKRDEKTISSTCEANAMERTCDLIEMLNNTCRDTESAVGLARLRTILRYMLESNYKQNTTAVKCLQEWISKYAKHGKESGMPRIEIRPGDWAFDVGCADGAALDVLEEIVGEGMVRGFDINPLNALQDERIRLGVIDAPQERLSRMDGGTKENLSLERRFGTAGIVFAALVLDRVANQDGLLMNCKKLLRAGGTLVMPLLLPVKCEDDEPDLKYRLQYTVDPRTVGDSVDEDYKILADYLEEIGFVDIELHNVPITDPVSGRKYDNHYILVARKREENRRIDQNEITTSNSWAEIVK